VDPLPVAPFDIGRPFFLHWYVRLVPVAVAEKVVDAAPLQTVLLAGLEVIEGSELTVIVAVPLPVFEQFASVTEVTE